MKLSIIIPVFNEENTILQILDKVERINLEGIQKEIIIIDDGSTDGTCQILKSLSDYKIIFHEQNKGKGAAIKTGLKHATGDIVIIQDADLEYNPEEIPKLIQPILKGETKVVYGSRELKFHNHSYYSYYLGNKLVTLVTNLLFGSKITDMETCYKIFTKEIANNISLNANGFDFEPEITAKILRRKEKILELPIDYTPRKKKDGKKVSWKDGAYALWILLKFRFLK